MCLLGKIDAKVRRINYKDNIDVVCCINYMLRTNHVKKMDHCMQNLTSGI